MTRQRFTLLFILFALGIAAGGPLAVGSDVASAMPARDEAADAGRIGSTSPADVPSEDLSWFPTGIYGGPVYGLGMSPLAAGGRIVFAGGHETFVSVNGGASWSLPRGDTGDVANLVTGPDGVAFVASPDGSGKRTTNGGQQWYATRLRGDAPVWFLAVSPDFRRDSVAYGITTGDWRLYRMEKGGSTWTEVVIETDADPRYQFGGVAFSPHYASDGVVFAGTDRGVYKTEDGGREWHLVGSPASGAPVFGAEGGEPSEQGVLVPLEYGDDPGRRFDPDLRDVFAYNKTGLFYSSDDGVTWQSVPLAAGRIHGLAVSNAWPSDPILVAAIEGLAGEVVAVSGDRGATWRQFEGPDGVVGTSVAVDREFSYVPPEPNPDLTVVYTPYLLRNWVQGDPFPPPRPTPPPYTGTRKVFLGTDGDGVWCSGDAGQSWERCITGLANGRATALAFLPGGPEADALAGTAASGLYRSGDGGRTWRWLDAGLPRGAGQTIHAIQPSPDFAGDRTAFLAANSGVWKTVDGGSSWRLTSGPAPAAALSVSPSYASDQTVVASGQISTDGGATWAPLESQIAWTSVAFSPKYQSDRTIFAGAMLPPEGVGYMLRTSTDGGATWKQVEHTQLRNRSVYAIGTLSVTAQDVVRLFVGTDRGLVQSRDGGKTWTQTGSMSRPVYGVASQPTQDPRYGQTAVVLAVGEQGALWSPDRGVTWVTEPGLDDTGHEAAISSDASVMLAAPLVRVARYGVGSARIFAPVLRYD
jgi:hypothetical protein